MDRSDVKVFIVLTFAAMTAFAGPVVNAQRVSSGQARVTVAAPIFLYPDPNRTPLRVADAGLAVVIIKTEGDWYLVEFQDPEYGRRQGYIERRFVDVLTPSANDATHDAKPSEPTPKATPALAHAGGPPPTASAQSLGAQAFAAIDFNAFAASNTFNAVFGSSVIPGYGGGVDITGVWRNLFVRVAVTRISKTGSRVFVNGSDVFPLNGQPAKLSMTPIEAGAGWRFKLKKQKLLTPYVGGAALIVPYRVDYPTSTDLNESETFTGGEFFGGVQYAITKVLVLGGEGQYRLLPNALQSDLASSAAAAYNETQGGGFTGRITIGVKFGK